MWDLLDRLRQEGVLVELKREDIDEDETFRGFVAAVSADFVVLSVVDPDCDFDGSTLLQTDDVTLLKWGTQALEARTRVLRETPTSPPSVKHIDLSSWETVVRTVCPEEPIVSFHREDTDDTQFYLGSNVTIEDEWLEADSIAISGSADGRFALKVADLTRLDFGGGYERAFRRMSQSTQP